MPVLARALVVLGAVAFGVIGVAGLVDPVWSLAPLHVRPDDPVGTIEIRAMYGGLQLGFAVFLVWCLRARQVHAGLLASTLTIGGLGLTRALGWIAAGMPASMHPWLVLLELSGALAGAVAWGRGWGRQADAASGDRGM